MFEPMKKPGGLCGLLDLAYQGLRGLLNQCVILLVAPGQRQDEDDEILVTGMQT